MTAQGDPNTYKIIGAAMEVHKELGCGFLKAIYRETLEREFRDRDILYNPQPCVQIMYEG